MSNRYKQSASVASANFMVSAFGEAERSIVPVNPVVLTAFNAGEIVPILCEEVLPTEHMSVDLEAVIRQTTVLTPTMGDLFYDIYAFFVPNRIVNESFVAVFGENFNGKWAQEQIFLAPLFTNANLSSANARTGVQVPVGSVADYYGFPTQDIIPADILESCHDLKFRGYVEIYNRFFRDENYQAPIPYSKLNIYEGFF